MLLNKKAKEKKGMCFIMEEKKEEKRVTEENKATKKEAVEKFTLLMSDISKTLLHNKT